MVVGLIILAVVVIGAFWWIGVYNKLIKNRNLIEECWSQIDVQLTRRYDLIPNLVETVKGFATHERETLTAVMEARNKAVSGNLTKEETMAANDTISKGVMNILAVSEAYPDLKNQGFLDLQEELVTTENKISYARQLYNKQVVNYNNMREVVPSNIVAKAHNFEKETVLEAAAEERVAVKVSF